MNYQQFVAVLNEKTTKILGPDVTVCTHHALKNNGAKRTGLTLSQKCTNISPTIYLEEFYLQFQHGRDLDDIAHCIASLYHEVKFEHSWELSQVQDFQCAKSKLTYKLIHLEKNRALLEKVPHVPYMDLAIVFFLLIETTEKGAATILVTNDMLEYWDASLEQIYQFAVTNTPQLLHAEFKPMQVVIRELLGKQFADNEEEDEDESYMYVLSNHHRHFGAACILYPHMLEEIGQQLGEDYYILPSSIHEMIILPASHSLTLAELDEMIVEINATQVSEEDVLADHAYYYSRKENQLLQAH